MLKNHHKILFSGMMGNLVEAYDVSICGLMAGFLSAHLMSGGAHGVLVIFTVFFLAYLARPIGAFVSGIMSDIYGRKTILMLSIFIMGLSTSLIGFIPDFKHIGLWATLALLSLRVIQSLSCGAEFLNSSSYLVESGDDKQKGFRGCWSSVGVMSGFLVACIVAHVVLDVIKQNPNNEWVWRLPFIIAFIGASIGIYIRQSIPESLQYVLYYSDKQKPSYKTIVRNSLALLKRYPFLFYFAFVASFLSVSTTFLFYVYTPIHAKMYSHLSDDQIFFSNTASLFLIVMLIPLFGSYLDKIDRLSFVKFATLGFMTLIYPFFYAVNYGNFALYLGMQLAITVPAACYYSVTSVLLTDIFPLQIRCTVLSAVYSVAASLAAGLVPLLSMLSVQKTHVLTAPSWLIIVIASFVMYSLVLLKSYREDKNQYLSLEGSA